MKENVLNEVKPEEGLPQKQPDEKTQLPAKNKSFLKLWPTIDRYAKVVRIWSLNFLILFFAFVLLKIIIQEIYDRGYHIQAIRVPAEFQANGYDGVTTAFMLLGDVNLMIERGNNARSLKEIEEYKDYAERNQLQVEFAGVGISPEVVSSYIKSALGVKSRSINGEIVRDGDELKFFLRISGHPTKVLTQHIATNTATKAFERLLQKGAEEVLKQNNPSLLGLYYSFSSSDKDKTEETFHFAIQSQPNQASNIYAWLAEFIYEHDRDSTEAMSLIRRSIAINPKNSNAYRVWAGVYEENKEKSIQLFRKSVALDPTDTYSLGSLGVKLYLEGRQEEAIECFRPCYSLDSTSHWVLYWWAQVLIDQNKLEEANRKIERMKYLNTDIGTRCAIGNCLIVGDTARARRELKTLTRAVGPHFSLLIGYLNDLASRKKSHKQYDIAFRLVRFALKLDSTTRDAAHPYSTLAELYALTGKKEKFYNSLEKAFHLGYKPRLSALNDPYKIFSKEERYQKLLAKFGIR